MRAGPAFLQFDWSKASLSMDLPVFVYSHTKTSFRFLSRQRKYREAFYVVTDLYFKQCRGNLTDPGGYFQIRRSGGLDLTSSLEAKFGARPGQVHQIRGKIWEVLSPQDAKVGKSPNFAVTSEIQRAKFGVFVTFIFGGKIWGSNKNFRGKFWGQAPPDLQI